MREATGTDIIRRRKAKRYGQGGAVTLRRAVSAPALNGSLFDLSSGGCLVWADRSTRFDPAELIEIKLQSDSLIFRVMGSVRHISEKGRLLGIEFQRLGAKDTRDLELFITQLQAAADRENGLANF